jgi:hypothetical protein
MVECLRCGAQLGPAEARCPICGTPREVRREEAPERPVEAGVLGDSITLKDYYDLRDLRLMLWSLERELGDKYGMPEARELAARLRPVIERKIEEVRGKIR